MKIIICENNHVINLENFTSIYKLNKEISINHDNENSDIINCKEKNTDHVFEKILQFLLDDQEVMELKLQDTKE